MGKTHKTSVILGCSHAAGSEMEQDPTIDLKNLLPNQFGYIHSYPVQLSSLLGYEIVQNHAIPGGSNDAMFRIFEEFINPYKKIPRPDIVIACWSGAERSEVWSQDEVAWQGLAAGKQRFYKIENDPYIYQGRPIQEGIGNEKEYISYQKQWVLYQANSWWGRLNKIKNILALNSLAKLHNIPVINIDSFDAIQGHEFGHEIYYPVYPVEFSDWAKQSGHKATENGHYFLKAHTMFANYLYEKIDKAYHAWSNRVQNI